MGNQLPLQMAEAEEQLIIPYTSAMNGGTTYLSTASPKHFSQPLVRPVHALYGHVSSFFTDIHVQPQTLPQAAVVLVLLHDVSFEDSKIMHDKNYVK